MEEDDERLTENNKRTPTPNVPPLPAQLGQKLRALFADVEAQPVLDRLLEILEQLAAKEKKTE